MPDPSGPPPPEADDRASRRWGTVIVWFRRDLRLADHPSLTAAVDRADHVVPLFVVDPRLVRGPRQAPVRTWFMSGALGAFDDALHRRGARLLVREGSPEQVVVEVAREVDADAVLVTRDVSAFARRRDLAVADTLARDGRRLIAGRGLLLVEPERLLTLDGSPFRVFTPFWRALGAVARRPLLPAPASIALPRALVDGDDRPMLRALGLGAPPPLRDVPAPGEPAARERLQSWITNGLARYGADRDLLSGEGTSRLGADLHLGLLSPRQVEDATAARGEAAVPFLRQLAWREFYHHDLFHRVRSGATSGRRAVGLPARSEAEASRAVAAWRDGQTGIPVVDAGMRQLAASGWLSNRARLVVATFLTRHLGVDHRVGEAHFLRTLVDGDVANNAGGWDWVVGVGPDAPPAFRIIDPVRHGERFDPDGSWVRRWVPELATVPLGHLHAPWRMSVAEATAIGFEHGTTYPAPIVDLADARRAALARARS